MKKWFIFYTYPKSEKYLYQSLTQADFEVYLPLQEKVRQWHDRKKRISVPLFPNYIFVKTEHQRIYTVLKFPRIVNCIKFNNKPSFLKEDEIELIRNIENNFTNIVTSNKLAKGERTKIQGGLLDGLEGIIEENRDGKKIVINIDSISYSLKVSLIPNEILKKKVS